MPMGEGESARSAHVCLLTAQEKSEALLQNEHTYIQIFYYIIVEFEATEWKHRKKTSQEKIDAREHHNNYTKNLIYKSFTIILKEK